MAAEKRNRIVAALIEGCSIRATERLCGAHRDTVMHLGLTVGEACHRLHNAFIGDVQVNLLEVDEIWSWVGKKQRRLTDKDPEDLGDQWTYVGLDANKKTIISYRVGKRTAATTDLFAADLRARITNKPQITSDGYGPYVQAVARAFGADADYAMLVKRYGGNPSRFVGATRTIISGNPCPEHISTSFVERENLTMRTAIRRFVRRTNAFSKKLRHHCAAVALYVGHYNFCRVHATLKATPCMAIGVTEHVWSIGDLVDAALSIAPERELVSVSVIAEVVPQIAAPKLVPERGLAEVVAESVTPELDLDVAAPELVPERGLVPESGLVPQIAAPELVPEHVLAEPFPEVVLPEPATEEVRQKPHYLPRTIKEKWQAVTDLLKEAGSRELSDNQIAQRLQITHSLVGRVRKKLEADGIIPPVPVRLGADKRRRSMPGKGSRCTWAQRR